MCAKNIFVLCLAFLVLLALSHAATIHGTVYDLDLNKAKNSKVEINTIPKQTIIAQNGSYSFNVPVGKYILQAYLFEKNSIIASVQENITVKQDGNYVLDLILFPELEEGIEDLDIEVNGELYDSNIFPILFTIGILALSIIMFFTIKKIYNKKSSIETKTIVHVYEKTANYDNDPEKIIDIIKKEGGRTTQKDIRRQLPLSEAKISLMIAELEHKGLVEKIKKGRGNIVILKK